MGSQHQTKLISLQISKKVHMQAKVDPKNLNLLLAMYNFANKIPEVLLGGV